jgi:hypothetical protein
MNIPTCVSLLTYLSELDDSDIVNVLKGFDPEKTNLLCLVRRPYALRDRIIQGTLR